MLEDAHEQFHELQRRKEVAEGLRGILAVLNSDQPLEAVLDYITLCASQLLRADAVAIYRLQPGGNMLVIQSSRGLSEEYLENSTILVGQAATGQAVFHGRPFVIPDIGAEVATLENSSYQEVRTLLRILSKQYQAILSVPLVIKQEITGALTLYYVHRRDFQPEEIDLAVSFCDQVALALENARLREKIQAEAVTAERNRIARDLHDSVTQTIFSASLIADVLPVVWKRDAEEGKHALEELRQLTRGALAEMRTLLLELRPAGLAEARLSDLLKQLAEAIASRIRIPVKVQFEGEASLPPEVKIAFYRIAQEAFNNLAKHAGASEVEVVLKSLPARKTKRGRPSTSYSRAVRMSIRDNGCGFTPETVSSEHLGLAIMRERANNCQAVFSVSSQEGCGTEISLRWPK